MTQTEIIGHSIILVVLIFLAGIISDLHPLVTIVAYSAGVAGYKFVETKR